MYYNLRYSKTWWSKLVKLAGSDSGACLGRGFLYRGVWNKSPTNFCLDRDFQNEAHLTAASRRSLLVLIRNDRLTHRWEFAPLFSRAPSTRCAVTRTQGGVSLTHKYDGSGSTSTQKHATARVRAQKLREKRGCSPAFYAQTHIVDPRTWV